MDRTTPDGEFVQRLIAVQDRLYAYIFSLAGDTNAADDVLQQSNIVLWEKADQFRPGTDFGAWACSVAHYEVLAWRKKRGRDRLLFDDRALGQLAGEVESFSAQANDLRLALRHCVELMPPRQRKLLDMRYVPGMTVGKIAQQLARSAASISQTLYRIRAALADCVERSLAKEGPA